MDLENGHYKRLLVIIIPTLEMREDFILLPQKSSMITLRAVKNFLGKVFGYKKLL